MEGAKRRLRNMHVARFGGAQGGPRAGGEGAGAHTAPFVFASAPGRVELAGNHTDHQGGCALAAAIDRRAYGLAAPNGTDEVRVAMEGFGEASVHLSDLEARADERGASRSLVRGMAAACVRSGGRLRGFDLAVCSDVPVGCGLSSSAAFEMLLGAAMHALCESADVAADGPGTGGAQGARPCGPQPAPLDPMALALEGAWAERNYFGKPCGLQDQLASACGGIVALDFSGDEPQARSVAFDWEACGHALCLIDCRCDHARYIDEYAAVPADMRAVARWFGCARLEDVPYRAFLDRFADAREALGDRAVLRALHYFEETRRAQAQLRALESGKFGEFLELVRASGASSAQFLQNVSPHGDGSGACQPAMVVLALCAHLLDGDLSGGDGAQRSGAYRIHGGGFGGSVLAIVDDREADAFMASMDALLGYDACKAAAVSPLGVHVERMAR